MGSWRFGTLRASRAEGDLSIEPDIYANSTTQGAQGWSSLLTGCWTFSTACKRDSPAQMVMTVYCEEEEKCVTGEGSMSEVRGFWSFEPGTKNIESCLSRLSRQSRPSHLMSQGCDRRWAWAISSARGSGCAMALSWS